MGSITYRYDTKWNTALVRLPGTEKWDLISLFIIRNGLTADLNGQQMIFIDTLNSWTSVSSGTAALRVCQLMGNDNASVNYVASYEPYYSKITKSCNANPVSHIPTSVCIGTERLAIEIDPVLRKMVFAPVPPLSTLRKPHIPPEVYGLCYQPADHVDIPQTYVFPGNGKVLNFLSPLFPNLSDMITYLWIIGNAAMDPVARPRCLMLCGPGGSGKSTAIRMATNALYGCTNLIPDNILTRDHEGLSDKIASIVVKSRMVTCYELDLDNRSVNMSLFKNITGGDNVKVGQFMAKAVCSFMIATNGLPDQRKQEEFGSDAISRRMVLLKMSVDSSSAPYEPDPTGSFSGMDFLCAALYVRRVHKDMPITPSNVLLSLCQAQYFEACKLVEECSIGDVSFVDGREVLALLAGLLNTEVDKLVNRCKLISMSCVELTPFGYIISGLRPLLR